MRIPVAIALLGAALLSFAAPQAEGAFRGKIEIRHRDDFARERTHTSYKLVQGKRKIPLMLARAPRIPSGSRVVVRGRRVGSRIRGSVRPRGVVHAASVPPGARETAVILINFGSDTSQPWTPAFVRQRVFTASNSTSAFYSEESYGDVSLTGEVYGWYTIAASSASCGSDDVDLWAEQAQAAAAADGFDAGDYQHIIYAFPAQASCDGWAGLGELPGDESWMNGNISTRVVAHELGHNMGLHHASSISCTSSGTTVAYSSTCTPDEYGDPFDVMGSSSRHNNAWHLRQLGFIASGNATTVSTSGTYTLSSAIARGTTGQTQLLRVPIAGTSPQKYYDLEVRSSGGVFDNYLSTNPAVNGVTIHVDRNVSSLTQSLLVDATPGSSSGFSDAPLPADRSFTDGTVTIAVHSAGAGTATVDVLTSAQPDTTPPSAPTPLHATPSSNRVTVTWHASTDNVEVAGYRLYRDGALLETTTSPSYVDYAVTAGTSYSYRVEAFDAAGNSSTSETVDATVPPPPDPAPQPEPDPQPTGTTPTDPPPPSGDPPVLIVDPPMPPADTVRPNVRITAPGKRARVRRRALVRARASDNSGVVRTEIWVDGKLRKSANRSVVTWRLRGARRGRHLIVVRAYDAAGNRGRASVRVRIIR